MCRASRAVYLAWFLVCVGYAAAADVGNTIAGPETDTLLPKISGYLLIDRDGREITAIDLPSLKETIVRPSRPADPNDDPTIHALAGPDAEGRIAYIEDHFFVKPDANRRHLLKTINLDGSGETEFFSRPGDAMWATSAIGHGEIGEHLALSPAGGQVAFLSGLRKVQMPGALLQGGSVEIWDIVKKAGGQTDIKAVDEGLAWFPDGNRLAYVKLVDAKAGLDSETNDDPFAKSFQGWDQLPAVFVRDIAAGTEKLLSMGWRPVVSCDGKLVLVADLDGSHWRLVDEASGRAQPATWPGLAWSGAFAMPVEDDVLSWCLPTEGHDVKYTENNSPLRGPKEMLALKLARVNSNEFQTVVPYVDPRKAISFGQVKEK